MMYDIDLYYPSLGKRDIVNYIVEGNVAVVTINDPSAKVNTLSDKVMNETLEVLTEVTHDSNVKSVVLMSGKPDCFIAGADINMLGQADSVAKGVEISRSGQRILGMIADSKKPIVAAISGSCLGGGLEVIHFDSLVLPSYTKQTNTLNCNIFRNFLIYFYLC